MEAPTTPISPAPFQQQLLPSPPSLASPIITVPPSPPTTTPISPAPFQQQLSVTATPIPPSYPSVDTTPPDTIITSAIDNSTGLNVQNGGEITASNSITLIFGGIDDSGIYRTQL